MPSITDVSQGQPRFRCPQQARAAWQRCNFPNLPHHLRPHLCLCRHAGNAGRGGVICARCDLDHQQACARMEEEKKGQGLRGNTTQQGGTGQQSAGYSSGYS